MDEITPVQKEQLNTWAGQRDALLSEISSLRVAKEGLEKENKELAISSTDITAQMNQIIGRIEELKKKEQESVTLKSIEVSGLESLKSGLESDITNLEKLNEVLSEQKKTLESDIAVLLETFKTIDGKVSDLNQIVDHVTRVSSDNIKDIDTLVANLKKAIGELIDVNTKNVFETNIVIEKLPKMLVEIQKKGLVRNKI